MRSPEEGLPTLMDCWFDFSKTMCQQKSPEQEAEVRFGFFCGAMLVLGMHEGMIDPDKKTSDVVAIMQMLGAMRKEGEAILDQAREYATTHAAPKTAQ